MIKRIAIVTPGGDAPGINAAIRAVVRKSLTLGIKTYGIKRGYAGLLDDEFIELDWKSVSGIMEFGGTILHTERFEKFNEEEYIDKACEILYKRKIDGLIVIGGEGSLSGGNRINKTGKIGVIGIPGSIDNDIYGTDETIGFDTACNTAVEAIKKIKDTSTSYERIFVIEVMGKRRGFIALNVGITVGAEAIVIPEIRFDIERFIELLNEGKKKGMKRAIIVYAEGVGGRKEFVERLSKETGLIVRETVLGYIQRGGSPTYRSRILASMFGSFGIDVLLQNPKGAKMVGIKGGTLNIIDIESAIKHPKSIDDFLLNLHRDICVFKL
uniref:ATP-dependent 6-phosphofructokinase n=1 Tax=candidate division WOR-3 bacterium TaxID=2052148 RepID=A0A7C4YHY0_UNCW3